MNATETQTRPGDSETRRPGELKPKPVTKRTHPTEDGWLYLNITLKDARPRTDAELRQLVCLWRDPAEYEIALAVQRGKTVRGVTRELNRKDKAA